MSVQTWSGEVESRNCRGARLSATWNARAPRVRRGGGGEEPQVVAAKVQGVAVDERRREEQRRDRDPVGVEVAKRNPERIGDGLRLARLRRAGLAAETAASSGAAGLFKRGTAGGARRSRSTCPSPPPPRRPADGRRTGCNPPCVRPRPALSAAARRRAESPQEEIAASATRTRIRSLPMVAAATIIGAGEAQQGSPRSVRVAHRATAKAATGGRKLVGVTGFEPATPASRTQYSTRLSYTPMREGGGWRQDGSVIALDREGRQV